MSLRTFTVFQDTPSNEEPRAEVTRPNAITTRSQTHNNVVSSNTSATMPTPDPDKENYHPVTGERAGPGGSTVGKKRKTGVLLTKVQPPTDKSSQPEKKKRKPSPPSSNSAETKPAKRSLKSSVITRKSKRTGSRKISPLPRLPEEDVGKVTTRVTQREIDSRCKELTLKPLADVSEAYDELSVFCPPSSVAKAADAKEARRNIKAPSEEPEIRDYFEPSEKLFASTRVVSLSDAASEDRTFSTPERKQIYAAFTFSSPLGSNSLVSGSS